MVVDCNLAPDVGNVTSPVQEASLMKLHDCNV